MAWQIEKTTKHCQDCNATIAVSQHYFSALFLNTVPLSSVAPIQSAAESEPRQRRGEGQLDKSQQPVSGESRLLRLDFCANCWEKRTAAGEEPPFSFWQTIIDPPAEPPKTPREVLLNFFDNLFKDVPEMPPGENVSAPLVEDTKLKSQVKYLFALIMMRKKLLRLKSPLTRDNARYLVLERFAAPPDGSKAGQGGKVYEVAEVNISDAELDSLRQEFSQLFEFRI